MEFKNKYFHSIHPYKGGERREELEEILYKLECILKSGYILPYKKIKKLYPDISRHPLGRNNEDDKISIALDRNSEEPVDYEYRKKEHRSLFFEDAYDMFTLEEPAIVLNEGIKERYDLIVRGMYLEREVAEPISLDFMDALSIPVTEEVKKYFDSSERKEPCVCTELYFNHKFLTNAKKLLASYNRKVPVVSIWTGNEFQPRVRQRKPQGNTTQGI